MADGTQVFDYTFPAGPMGIALLESPQGMHIISIQPGSMADALGVYLGGTIVAVGDHDVRHMSRQEMMTTIHMQPRPITIRVSTTAETRLDPNAAAEALANLSITKKSPDERLLAAAAKGDPQLILSDSLPLPLWPRPAPAVRSRPASGPVPRPTATIRTLQMWPQRQYKRRTN